MTPLRPTPILLLACLSCSPHGEEGTPDAAAAEPGPLTVYVVNEPLRTFAERIGGSHARVHFPAPQGIDPAHWTPDAETVASYQRADLILRSGAGYARWIDLASLPAAHVVDTSAGHRERLVERAGSVTHRHGPGGAHSHGELAFTTWLDPELAKLQARAVADALGAARPAHAASFEANLAELLSELDALDARLAAAATRLAGTPLLFSHPVYDYLIRRYELDARSLEWEPDEAPDPRQWRELDTLLREHPAGWLLWEAEPQAATAAGLRERGVESRVFDPCGKTPAEGDFLAAMARNAETLEQIAVAG